MTKAELIAEAEHIEAQEVDAEGAWADYLHAKAAALRHLAQETED